MATTSKPNDELHNLARAAGRNLRHCLDADWQGKDALKTASAAVQERPLPAMLIALGLGLLAGLVVSRR